MKSHPFRIVAIPAIAILLLAGCSAAPSPSQIGSPPPASSPDGSAAATPEIADLVVGILPIIDLAPLHIAIAQGLFEAEGLRVSTEVLAGGAAAIPALVAGDLQVTFGAWPSFLKANAGGIELRAVADGDAAAPGFTQFLALPGSDLEGNPAGMAGKKIAINTLGNLGELAVRWALTEAGVDPDSVQLVEIPFPDMGAALESGNVDVIWAVEPGVTVAKSVLGAVVVVDSYIGPMAGFPVAGYQVTRQFAERYPNTVAAFRRAITAAAAIARANPQLVTDLAPSFTSLTPELAAQISLPVYGGTIEAATLHRVYDLLVSFGIMAEGLDVDALIAP